MASASSRKSLDTDSITLRKVFAKLPPDGRFPSAGTVLAGVGDSQTYWANPATLGGFPTFNEIQTDVGTWYPSTSRTVSLVQATGLGFSTLSTNSLLLTGRLFGQLDISGATSLYAYSNAVLNGTLKVAPGGYISTVSDSNTNTLFLSSTRHAPTLSTPILAFQQLKVVSTVASPLELSSFAGNSLFVKQDFFMYPSLVGIQDFLLHPTFAPSQIQWELSSYSAKGFLTMSTLVGTNFTSTLSTISSIYVDKFSFSTAYTGLSTQEGFNASTSRSTIIGFSNYTQLTYNTKMGETLARATIIQLVDQFGLLNVGLSSISSVKTPVYIMTSTNKGIQDRFSTQVTASISTFENFGAGSLFNFRVNVIYGVSTFFSTLSTQMNSNYEGFSNLIQLSANQYIEGVNSTSKGLGTLNFVSSASLQSSLRFANTFGDYISIASLRSTIPGLVSTGYVRQQDFLSTFSINYIVYPDGQTFSTNLTSTTKGTFDTAPYISALTLRSTLLSTTAGFPALGLQTYTGTSLFNTALLSTTKGVPDYAAFTAGYVSTSFLQSAFLSTNQNLGSLNYISTLSFASTLQSTLDGLVFLTGQQVQSTLDGSNGYIVEKNLVSTSEYFLGWRGVFRSTIPYQGTPIGENFSTLLCNIQTNPMDPNSFSTMGFFSTFANIKFNDYFPYIRDSSRVVIECSPGVIFTRRNFTPVLPMAIFTDLRYDNNTAVVSSSIYYEQDWWIRADVLDLQANTSNFWQRNLTFSFSGSDFKTLYNKELTVMHYLYMGCNFYGALYPVFRDLTFTNVTPQKNSFFVSIYN